MIKVLLLFLSLFTVSLAINPIALQYSGVDVIHKYLDGSTEEYNIQRENDSLCLNISVAPEDFSKENISNNISDKCKKTLISTKGVIQPLYINEQIKTYSEIEVLDFIYSKSSEDDSKYILVDSRKPSWFNFATIPSAVNIPYEDLKYDEDFEEEYFNAYKNLGIKITKDKKYDFTNAKTALFFCNGAWCPVSTKSIKFLLSIGYPPEKLIWYRGGIASWEALNLTLTKELK